MKIETYNYNLSEPYLLGGTTQAPPAQFTTNAFSKTGPWQTGRGACLRQSADPVLVNPELQRREDFLYRAT